MSGCTLATAEKTDLPLSAKQRFVESVGLERGEGENGARVVRLQAVLSSVPRPHNRHRTHLAPSLLRAWDA